MTEAPSYHPSEPLSGVVSIGILPIRSSILFNKWWGFGRGCLNIRSVWIQLREIAPGRNLTSDLIGGPRTHCNSVTTVLWITGSAVFAAARMALLADIGALAVSPNCHYTGSYWFPKLEDEAAVSEEKRPPFLNQSQENASLEKKKFPSHYDLGMNPAALLCKLRTKISYLRSHRYTIGSCFREIPSVDC